MDSDDDDFDYVMSDAFVSQTRRVPYRTGFRSRKLQGKSSIKELLRLSDRDFSRYIKNGCRLPGDQPVNDLAVLQAEMEELRANFHILQRQMRQLMQPSSGLRPSAATSELGGLDVKPRA